jgi:hypothetical protein
LARQGQADEHEYGHGHGTIASTTPGLKARVVAIPLVQASKGKRAKLAGGIALEA